MSSDYFKFQMLRKKEGKGQSHEVLKMRIKIKRKQTKMFLTRWLWNIGVSICCVLIFPADILNDFVLNLEGVAQLILFRVFKTVHFSSHLQLFYLFLSFDYLSIKKKNVIQDLIIYIYLKTTQKHSLASTNEDREGGGANEREKKKKQVKGNTVDVDFAV